MKFKMIFILSAALASAPLAAHAGSGFSQELLSKIQPGEWQAVTKTKIAVQGTNMQMPTKTYKSKSCLTREEILKRASSKAKLAELEKKGWKCSDVKKDINGNVVNFSLSCKGKQGTIKLNGKTTIKSKTAMDTHAVMRGTINNMPMTVTTDATSTRIGECKPGSKKGASSGGK